MIVALVIFILFLIPYVAYSLFVLKKMREMGSAADFTHKMAKIYLLSAGIVILFTLIWLVSAGQAAPAPIEELL